MGRLMRPLLKHEIEEAQENSLSASQAAKYLGVAFETYKKYAQFYGIYENLLNKKGVGVAKGYAMTIAHSTKLKDIFENKHPKYPLQRLRWRMVARGLMEGCCAMCGFEEERITDGKKPILMIFKDTEGDYTPTNLVILCYNCCFLSYGAPYAVNKRSINRTVKLKEDNRTTVNKFKDPSNSVILGKESLDDLTEAEIRELRLEIDRELGRT